MAGAGWPVERRGALSKRLFPPENAALNLAGLEQMELVMIKKGDPNEPAMAFEHGKYNGALSGTAGFLHQAAYDFGRAAAMQKLPVTANPYSPATEAVARQSWDLGYLSLVGES